MKIDIIIKDVDVSVAQKILALLPNDETVTVEKVAKTPVVEKATKSVPLEKAFKEAKANKKRYTCDRCGKVYVYANSYNSHRKHCKASVEETPKPKKEKPAKKKFERKMALPKRKVKKAKLTYKGISDSEVEDMTLSALTGNPNTIVTSAQIAGNYVSTVQRNFGKTAPEVTSMAKAIEGRIVAVMVRATKALGTSQCMSMPIEPNGLQIALFAKSGLTLRSLKKKLE
jgi:predicted transcriptional regulator